MPSALSLQKPRPGMGTVVLVDGAGVVTLGFMVVVKVTTGLEVVADAVVVTAGLLVVVVGRGGISV